MNEAPDFCKLSTPARAGELEFLVTIPDGWQQGRGAFGGLVLANLLRAARACEPDKERTLRSLTGELVGPVQPGPAQARVEILRRGNGVSTLAVRLTQEAELVAHAVVLLGRARPTTGSWNRLQPPVHAVPWQQVEVTPIQPPLGPSFARFLEYRSVGMLPFSGGTEPSAAGWVRFVTPGPERDAEEIVALADAWWPSSFATESLPRPMATLAFTFELLQLPDQSQRHQPLFHRAQTISAHEGYTVELRELWTADGALVGLNQQTLTVIK
jgi:acyl-CoA thioesterase